PGPDVCGLPGYRWSADSVCQRRPAKRLVLPARLASDEPASQPQADHSDGDSRSIGRRVGAQAPRHGRCAQDVSVLKGGCVPDMWNTRQLQVLKQEAGFTLVDLMLSTSILLVVSGIVVGATMD